MSEHDEHQEIKLTELSKGTFIKLHCTLLKQLNFKQFGLVFITNIYFLANEYLVKFNHLIESKIVNSKSSNNHIEDFILY